MFSAMSGSRAANATAISGSDVNVSDEGGSVVFDFGALVARANELGAENDQQRADKAKIPLRTYYRLQAGEANMTLRRTSEIAQNLGIDPFALIKKSSA